MKTETSAGGIVVCSVAHQWYVLVIRDMNDTWTFPKGLIEAGEAPEVAAGREILEEVGISDLRLLTALSPIQYFYTRKRKIKKTVYYFVFRALRRGRPKPQKQEGISEARWMSVAEAMKIIGYRQTNVPLLEEAWKLLKRRT